MRAAPVELFSTSILGNHKVRSRHERYVSVLTIKKVPYVYHDLASDEEAKSRWRRKAKDAQIPGLLVHNEWRGTFEEFEEAIEFGELDLFLRIDHERAQREAEEGTAPSIAEPASTPAIPDSEPSGAVVPALLKAEDRKPSRHIVNMPKPLAQPRSPSNTGLGPVLPTAAPRTIKRQSADADTLLKSLGLSEMSLSQQELDDILEAGSSGSKTEATTSNGGQDKLGLGTASARARQPVQRTYVPSAEAGVKPLRLAKMGTSRSGSLNAPAPDARYNASTMSSRSLAAEAQASASSRAFSSRRLREAVSQGDDLKEAMSSTRAISNTDKAEQIVGREDLDSLMASLGLSDVKMSNEEAEAFLFQGTIPEGMASGGSKLGRSSSKSEIARKETAARELALKAREKGYGTPDSPTRRSSSASSSSSRSSSRSKSKLSTDAGKGSEDADVKTVVENTSEKVPDVAAPEPLAGAGVGEMANVGDQTTLIHDDEEEEATNTSKQEVASEGKPTLASEIEEQTPRNKTEPLPDGSGDTVMDKGGISADLAPEEEDVASKDTIGVIGEHALALRGTESSTETEHGTKDGLCFMEKEEPEEVAVAKVGAGEGDAAALEQDVKLPMETVDEIAMPVMDKGTPPTATTGADDSAADGTMSTEKTLPSAPSSDITGPDAPSAIATTDSNSGRKRPALHFAGPGGAQALMVDLTNIAAPNSAPIVPSDTGARSTLQEGPELRQTSAPSSPTMTQRAKTTSSSPSASPSSSRRRAIDVQRPSISPSLSASPSMMLSSPSSMPRQGSFSATSPIATSKPNMQRSNSQASTASSADAKSPSSRSGRNFFGLGRRRSTKGKKLSRSNSIAAGEDSDEDIPTTFTDMPESRSPQTGSESATFKPNDRSQKTLSMILREADEALTGIDDDEVIGTGHERSSSSDDGMDSFHLELDDAGAIQARRK